MRLFFPLFLILFSTSNCLAEEYIEVKYIVDGSSSSTCLEVCENNGYECYDNVLQSTSCSDAALDVCGVSSITDATHHYQCDKGGCYVDCNQKYFVDRGSHYMTCYSEPICHHTDSSAGNFEQLCACAIITTTPSKPLHIYLWELIGMACMLLFLLGAGVAVLHYFFPGMFPTR